MSLYHFTMKQILRSEGKAVVNSAAYRAGERLVDEYYGQTWDYTKKQGVIYTEIMLPPHVPQRLRDRQTLWNEVEKVEKHPKAQLAHSFEFALQNELSIEENIELAKRFVQENFVARGMIADFAVHDPPVDDAEEPPNPHIHVLCPIRPIREDGSWGEKERREYLTDENGEPILDQNGKRKFRAVPTTDWSSLDALMEYRKNWCDLVNETFERKGLAVRIDHRSYKDQGLELLPTIHEGAAVCQMEAKGIRTEKRALNNLIRFVNRVLIEIKQTIEWSIFSRDRIRQEMEKLQSPTLIDLLQNYYDERNEVAETFRYGTNKAKLTNLKDFAETIAFMESRGITTQEKLDEAIGELNCELKPVKKQIAEKVQRLQEVQKLIHMEELYQKYKPIHSAYVKKTFGKKKFYEEHQKELKQYQMASRIMKENLNAAGEIPLATWKREEKVLLAEKEISSDQKKHLSEELNKLQKIKDCVNTVLMEAAPESTADARTKERTGIKAKLEEKKKLVKARDEHSQSPGNRSGRER